jgi:hypothetical protein
MAGIPESPVDIRKYYHPILAEMIPRKMKLSMQAES